MLLEGDLDLGFYIRWIIKTDSNRTIVWDPREIIKRELRKGKIYIT